MSGFKVYHTQRNKWYVIVKNWPLGLLLRHLPVNPLSSMRQALFLALLKGRGGAALRARLDVLKNLRSLLSKRRAVQALNKLSTGEIELLFSPMRGLSRPFSGKCVNSDE